MVLKKIFGGKPQGEDYVEIDVSMNADKKEKIMVRPFTLKQYDDITDILDSLRQGYTIAIIDIKPLKSKDVIELKRSIAKIKKTVEASNGNIAGFGENTIIVTPEFAEVYKHSVPAARPGNDAKDLLM